MTKPRSRSVERGCSRSGTTTCRGSSLPAAAPGSSGVQSMKLTSLTNVTRAAPGTRTFSSAGGVEAAEATSGNDDVPGHVDVCSPAAAAANRPASVIRTPLMDLHGKICLVTGASRGIGRATAQVLAARGGVVAAAASGVERLDDLGAASVHAADLADPAEARDLAAAVLERHGRVDVLVNNAGVRLDALVHKSALEDLDRAFQVNVMSPFVL